MGINVLSLFDGMSCGQIALERLGVEVDNYFACEIDKYAIKVTQANYPDTIQLGSVTDLDISKLPKIDLLIGGSPCTDLSFAGDQQGLGTADLETYLKLKSEGHSFEGQSFLFWEYIRIRKELMEVNPNLIWLLENVKMKKSFKEVFDEVAGGSCIEINSALVSAQNRVRNYWSNIEGIVQPDDKGIFLKDIIDGSYCDMDKSCCIDANNFKGSSIENYLKKSRRQLVFDYDDLSITGCRQVGRKINDEGKRDDYNPNLKAKQRIETREDGKAGCLTTVQKDSMIAVVRKNEQSQNATGNLKQYFDKKRGQVVFQLLGDLPLDPTGEDKIKSLPNGIFPIQQGKSRKFGNCVGVNNKGFTLRATQCNGVGLKTDEEIYYRKLTPEECEKLQTVPVGYTDHVSNTQRYKMLGNGWTVDVISHILSFADFT